MLITAPPSRFSYPARTMHWTVAEQRLDGWSQGIWPNFSPYELACKHCGQYYHWPEFLDRLQWVRTQINAPLIINSAHRCPRHNAHIGGAPLSQHKKLAVDISVVGHDRLTALSACQDAGFLGFGLYKTFLHIDLGPRRSWFGTGAKPLWH